MMKKYTKQEITEMADRCYYRCFDPFCEQSAPTPSGCLDGEEDKLFKRSYGKCHYSFGLPWSGKERWCFLWPCYRHDVNEKQKQSEIDILKSLTIQDLMISDQEKSR